MGLSSRRLLAEQVGCSLIEMPADLIKNRTECDLTGLPLGSFLDHRAIQLLYEPPVGPGKADYILHTEPSLPRTDGYGLRNQAPLKWYDQDWVDRFIKMTISISEHLRSPAFAMEIHPGDRRNSYADLIAACKELRLRHASHLGQAPLILLENRTGQFISTGSQLAAFWDSLLNDQIGLADSVGIVLDVQQLFTATGQDFKSQFDMIPLDAVKGLHIHCRHRTASIQDNIPWKAVFGRIRTPEKPLLINPEIHHGNAVQDAITFCNEMI